MDLGEGLMLLDGGSRLEIVDAARKDTGRYTCSARNLAGEVKRNFDVDIHGKRYSPCKL